MKEQYVSPEVKLVSYVAEEKITATKGENFINGDYLFDSVATINTSKDISYDFNWLP